MSVGVPSARSKKTAEAIAHHKSAGRTGQQEEKQQQVALIGVQ
jgi:hypothetical protein